MDPQSNDSPAAEISDATIDAFLKKWFYAQTADNRAGIRKTAEAYLAENPAATAADLEAHLDSIHAK